MADATAILNQADPVPFKVHDNGDGSFSLAVSPAVRGAFVDHSGSTPDAAEHQLIPANAARNYLLFQNNDPNGRDLWINFDTPALLSQPSIQISAGSAFVWESSFVPSGALHVIGSAAGITYTCKEG